MNETKNGIQTTVEAEKAGVSFIDLGAATISFNLREGMGIRYRTQMRLLFESGFYLKAAYNRESMIHYESK